MKLLQLAAVVLFASAATAKMSYITAFQFCQSLPQGDYCSPQFQRGFIQCPNSLEKYCPPNTLCQTGAKLGLVNCVPDITNPIVQLCNKKPKHTSHCLNEHQVAQCDAGAVFMCPPDMVCKKRGLRAYCVQPIFKDEAPSPSTLCKGASAATICDPVNAKRIIQCPSGNFTQCPLGQLCGISNDNPKAASCVPYEQNLSRWCSNKPLMSTFCLPGTQGKLVYCSLTPTVYECPSGKCRQNLGITASCAA